MPVRGPCEYPRRPQLVDAENKLIDWKVDNEFLILYEALEAIFERLCFLENNLGADLAIPGEVAFTPALYDYGTFTFESITVESAVPLTALHAILYYVNEIKASLRATTLESINNSDNPALVSVTVSGEDLSDPELRFEVGDLILINDPVVDDLNLSYEIAQLTAINAGIWTLSRGLFGSTLHSHLTGVTLFKVQSKHFEEAYDTQDQTIDRIDVVWPSACVVYCELGPESAGGFGAFVGQLLFPLASSDPTLNPPSPGFRTLAGDSLPIPDLAGSGAVSPGNLRSSYPIYLPDSSSIRCVYAGVKDAPVGANMIIQVRYRPPGGAFTNLELVTIPDGTDESFATSNIPAQRRMPYNQGWPPIVIPQGSRVDFNVTQVGSSNPGSGLCVLIET